MDQSRSIGPGHKRDLISIQRLITESSTQTRSHVIYIDYSSWSAQIHCDFEEENDMITDIKLHHVNQVLSVGLVSHPRSM